MNLLPFTTTHQSASPIFNYLLRLQPCVECGGTAAVAAAGVGTANDVQRIRRQDRGTHVLVGALAAQRHRPGAFRAGRRFAGHALRVVVT